MGILNRNEFDELKSLGLTPQQIKDAIEEGKTLKTKAAEIEAELGTTKTSLTSVNNQYEETKTRLAALEANSNRQPPKKEEVQRTSFLDNEDQAFNERFNDAVNPVARVALEAARNTAKMSARMSLDGQFIDTPGGRIPKVRLWDKWQTEIENSSKEVPLATLGNIQTWSNLLDYAIGKHTTELLGKTSDFIEGAGGRADVVIGGKKEPEKLNEEEDKTIAKMARVTSGRMTPEKYRETKEKMKFVNV